MLKPLNLGHSLFFRWLPPPSYWIKIKVDGAFCAATNYRGVSVICPNEVSSYARGFVRKISHVTNLRMVGVLAARDDVCWQQIILDMWVASRICHVHRSTNVVAHRIGKLVSIFNFASCWFEPPKLI
ncbi:hypothetical protein DVH24_037882 [Malus domestica]|uniref:RNase H type-1 domain-containing protein n=1 Tax=Malus domestica TaxID=3750 RepID=A0A498K206_MALDO|nr:hypothetical protein DVH24_037882 [Malus domestica]